jgi:hypothetical protein
VAFQPAHVCVTEQRHRQALRFALFAPELGPQREQIAL